MPFAFTVSASALRDLRPFTSTEESRPILNGILIETSGAMCATGGHVMLAVGPNAASVAPAPARDVIIRLDKAVPKWAEFVDVPDVPDVPDSSYADVPLVLKVTNSKGKVDYIPAAEVAGPFPNWRNVMPRYASATAPLPSVDPNLLQRFTVEGCPAVRFFADANSPESRAVRVAFEGRPEYVGVLMPRRSDELNTETAPPLPDFTDIPTAPAVSEAA